MPRRSRSVQALAAMSAATLLLTACSGNGGGGDEEDVRTLRLSHFMEPTHPHETCGMATIQENLEGTGLAVETYPAAQLGGQTEALEQIATGSLDMSINGATFLGVYYEPFGALDLGYLFDDAESRIAFQDTDEMQGLLDEIHEESGMKVFPAWYYGTRHVTANRPVEASSDLQGLKLRVPDAPMFIDVLSAMGAQPTPMALDELYMGLSQGTVDAQENPTPVISTMKLHEVQDDLSLTGHMVDGLHVVVAGDIWESLSSEEQEALETAILAGGEAANQCVIEEEEDYLEEFRAGDDIEVHDVDTSEFAQRVRDELSSQDPQYAELYELAQQAQQ